MGFCEGNVHSSDDVKITIEGVDYSLQEASDLGLLGEGGGGRSFGEWVDMGVSESVHLASNDGFVVAYSNGGNNPVGYADNSNPPTIQRTGSTSGFNKALTMPVKKGDYWKVVDSDKIYWIPIISSGGSGGTTYISDWQAISRGGSVIFSHELGTDALMTTVQFKPTLSGVVRGEHTSDYVGHGYGVEIYEISNNQIKVSGGSANLHFLDSNGLVQSYTSGYVRVLASTL